MTGSSKGEHGELFYLKAAAMAASSQDAQAAADTTAASFQGKINKWKHKQMGLKGFAQQRNPSTK